MSAKLWRSVTKLLALPLCAIALAVLTGAERPAAPGVCPLLQYAAAKPYGDTYTPEELSAMDTALRAVNMDRTDLLFKKDYAKGLQCLPIVRAEMADPLRIAYDMDYLAAAPKTWSNGGAKDFVLAAGLYFPDVAYAPSSEMPLPAGFEYTEAPNGFSEIQDSAGLAAACEAIIGSTLLSQLSAVERRDLLREKLPYVMAWHDVFPKTVSEEQAKAWDDELKTLPPDYLYAQASKLDIYAYEYIYFAALPRPQDWLTSLPREVWLDKPQIIDTEHGRIGLGTFGDDTWSGDFAILLDPGGNDHYVNCRIGAAYGARTYTPRLGPDGLPTGASADYSPLGDGQIAYFADLGGNDYYDCADTEITLGAAVLGVAAFYDLGQGNDRYFAGSCTLGAAMGGVATFYDDGGCDYYSGANFTQGAAGFGIGVMVDDSVQPVPDVPTDVETPDPIDWHAWDNDIYEAWSNAQAFARTRGVGLCINTRGNEVYHAGGVYLHAPLFQDRYQSFSQGFAIGERDIDYAGGIAMLLDYAGNDRYLGDIYNQGVGYWYSSGFLYDVAGNDLYEMTQYGQGSGIHLSIGGLIDNAGNDTYVMHSGLGQGGSHDFAASVQMDRGGNDHYMGMTSCNGTGLTNSVGMFFDRNGDDTYAARRDGYFNGGRPDRNSGSIGLFIDLSGKDDYLGIASDGGVWSSTFYGAGVDITPPPPPPSEFPSDGAANVVSGNAPIPEVCNYVGPLTQEVFDELWEISVRWEVGDNRYIVPKARERVAAFGPEVIPYLDAKLDNDNSGLAQRAYMDILPVLMKEAPDQVTDMLRRNAQSDDEIRRNQALYLIGELKLTSCEDTVVALLSSPDPVIQRRAIGVLGLIGSHAADEQLQGMLDPAADEAQVRIALTTLTDLNVDCYEQLRPLLSHPMITVRETLINQLGKHWDIYEQHVKWDVARGMLAYGRNEADEQLAARQQRELERLGIELPPAPIRAEDAISVRGLRTLLTVLARETDAPDILNVASCMKLLRAEDWGLRADAVRVIRHWQKLRADGVDMPGLASAAVRQMWGMLATETDPYVKFVATQ